MCSSNRACSSAAWSEWSSSVSSSRAERATCCRAKKPATTSPRITAVTRSSSDGGARGDQQRGGVATGAAQQRDRLDTSTMPMAVAMRTPARAASGITPTHGDATSTTTSSASDWVTAASRDRAPERDVDRGPGDRRGGRDPAEQRRHQVRHPLSEQLAVGVVPLANAHAVGHRRRQQALERRRARPPRRPGGSSEPRRAPRPPGAGTGRADRPGSPRSSRSRPAVTPMSTVATTTAGSETGRPGRTSRGERASPRRRSPATATGTQVRLGQPRRDRRDGGRWPSLACRVGAQDRRHLLEGDHDRDADGEALHHGQRDVAHVPPGSRVGRARSAGAPAIRPTTSTPSARTARRSARAPRSWRRSGR